MASFDAHVAGFFELVKSRSIEIYNEISLQHEFGVYLRSCFKRPAYQVQFERPTEFFGIKPTLLKKEIDIAIFRADGTERVAVELKFPRNGQYPEQMFEACRDLAFLEQLVASGFDRGLFVMAAEDRLFYEGPRSEGIYSYFRGSKPICGTIQQPTATRIKKEAVNIIGRYAFRWQNIKFLSYWHAEVNRHPKSRDESAATTLPI